MEKENGYLSIPEAAEKMGVAPLTVYKLVWDGKLFAIKIGRAWKIRPVDIEEMWEKEKNK